jgi:hypothetical protein
MSDLTPEQLLGWIYHRSKNGLFSFRRSQRDAALSDINHAVQNFGHFWNGDASKRDPNHEWMGEQP